MCRNTGKYKFENTSFILDDKNKSVCNAEKNILRILRNKNIKVVAMATMSFLNGR